MKIILLLLSISLHCFGIDSIIFDSTEFSKIERRAAFDIGSGRIKVQVSDIDISKNEIVHSVFSDSVKIPLREDLAKNKDGRLSVAIQNSTIDLLLELIKKVSAFHPKKQHGIGTEIFRLAKNGDQLLERIKRETGLDITVVSQEEEGILGFISAISTTKFDSNTVIAWDFGAGSLQLTAKCDDHYSVYQGKLGKIPLKNVVLSFQGKDHDLTLSPNPISKFQADQVIQFIHDTISLPEELYQKLHREDVIVLGVGINPLFGMRESSYFNINRVFSELNDRLDLDDSMIQIKDPIQAEASNYVVSNLILTYGLMKTLGITQIQYVETQGANAIGVLLSPKYWEEEMKTNL